MAGIFRIIVGGLFGLVSMLVLAPAFAAFLTKDSGAWMLLVIPMGALVAYFAPTMRRAFGRGFLMLGAATFALPLSAFLLSGRVASEMISQSAPGADAAATAVGAGIAGVAVTGVASFFGLIFGSILLLIGLVLALGGRREVIIVQHRGV